MNFDEMIFDTHAHYDDDAFSEDREEVLASLADQGIGYVVDVGASLASTQKAITLANTHPFLYAAAGVHPSETAELTEESFLWLREQLKEERVVAVGETGLDYYWPEPEHELQKYWFRRQLALAVDSDLPVIIHSREAAADTLEIIQEVWQQAQNEKKRLTGVIHCFSYKKEMAREYIKMGFYLGIGGVLTFRNARAVKEVAADIPISKLVLETDSPYLAPEPNRGKRNSSLNLPYVAAAMAELKGLTPEEIIRETTRNARTLYRI